MFALLQAYRSFGVCQQHVSDVHIKESLFHVSYATSVFYTILNHEWLILRQL